MPNYILLELYPKWRHAHLNKAPRIKIPMIRKPNDRNKTINGKGLGLKMSECSSFPCRFVSFLCPHSSLLAFQFNSENF